MTLVAGIDIGNATIELVLVDSAAPTRPIAWDTVPSGGVKGSAVSQRRAAALLERVERRVGARAAVVAVAPWRPVRTATAALPEASGAAGRLRVVASGDRTVGGEGTGIGRPVALARLDKMDGPAVAVAGREVGYVEVARAVGDALAGGHDVVAVLLENDEAVLVANRLPRPLPVYDGIDAAEILTCERVGVECRPRGHRLRSLNDALVLSTELGLDGEEAVRAATVTRELDDVSAAVVALGPAAGGASGTGGAWVELAGSDGPRRVSLDEALGELADRPPGRARRLGVTGPDGVVEEVEVDDLALVDLGRVADAVLVRRAATRSRAFAYAALASNPADVAGPEVLAAETGRETRVVAAEPVAARLAALTTPGASATDVTVLDLGGGSLDAIDGDGAVVVAGCGDLLTAATAAALGVSAAAAEWAKRGPSFRVEGPQLLAAEDGSRTPLPDPLDGGLVGRLVVPGPVGLLPISSTLGPGEWRILRRRLKQDIIGGAVRRALAGLGRHPVEAIVVGGPAGDDEVLAVLAAVLPENARIGRGNAAGVLGHRHAVAYGLGLLAIEQLGETPRHDG